MKTFKLLAVLCVLTFSLGILPQTVDAFAELPVAVVVVDKSGAVDGKLVSAWETRVKRRFGFPNYQIVPQDTVRAALAGRFPAADQKRPYLKQAQLEYIANTVPAELVVAIWVNSMREEVYTSWRGETIQWVYVNIDVTAYRKTDKKYLFRQIRYDDTRSWAASDSAYQVATDKFADVIDKFREELPILQQPET